MQSHTNSRVYIWHIQTGFIHPVVTQRADGTLFLHSSKKKQKAASNRSYPLSTALRVSTYAFGFVAVAKVPGSLLYCLHAKGFLVLN